MSEITRREFLRHSTALAVFIALESNVGIGCARTENQDLTKMVQKIDDGILLDYEIIPPNPKKRTKKFKNFKFKRPNREVQFSPDLDDKRWLQHYKNIENLIQQPVQNLIDNDVDPLFGFFAYRVHPTTLQPKYFHTGIDIFRPKGEPVLATYEGSVKTNKDEYGGNWIKITHPIRTKDGYHIETRYLHLDSFADGIVDGMQVQKGQPLGKLGGTGIMKGYFPHLHYEVVMINDVGPGKPLILDPSRVYFKSKQSVDGFFNRLFAKDDEQKYFRNLTGEIGAENTVENLGQLITHLNPDAKRFLGLYKQFWENEAKKGGQKYKQLLDQI